MPKVGNKTFPYTPAGMRAAKAASKRMPKKGMRKGKSNMQLSTDMGMNDPASMQAAEMRRRFGM